MKFSVTWNLGAIWHTRFFDEYIEAYKYVQADWIIKLNDGDAQYVFYVIKECEDGRILGSYSYHSFQFER